MQKELDKEVAFSGQVSTIPQQIDSFCKTLPTKCGIP